MITKQTIGEGWLVSRLRKESEEIKGYNYDKKKSLKNKRSKEKRQRRNGYAKEEYRM